MPGTLYTGVAGNVSLASAVQATIPVDGDVDSAATHTPGEQTQLDYIEALRQIVAGVGLPFFEGFESVTFPPTAPAGAWAAPSPRFNTDLAYQRDTSNPITGTASANRNSGQTASTNSSLGLSNVFLAVPSRMAFVFDLLCNASFGDHLDFFVDGVLTGKWSCTTNTNVSAGRFITDVLREGAHTFDWRFVRGASAAVASEKARLDAVNIIPESAWQDRAKRVAFEDEFFRQSSSTDAMWGVTSTGAAGGVNFGYGGANSAGNGVVQLLSGAVGAGDSEAIFLGALATSPITAPPFASSDSAHFPFMEIVLSLPSIANMFVEFGVISSTSPIVFTAQRAAWVYDSSVGTDWRFSTTTIGPTTTTNPTGVAAAAGSVRLGLTGCSGLTNGAGWLGTINGQSLPGAGANHMGSSQNNPIVAGASYQPYIRVGSRTAAAAKEADVDYFRFLAFRAATLIG